MTWADRTDFGAESNALTVAIAEARAAGRSLIDLTVSNPTRCGFYYDAPGILDALASEANLSYAAEPLGVLVARRAVAEQYYAPKGIHVSPEQIMLTASTSEAYGYLLRLLCNAGDAILVPRPSYPLFDLLARMHDVELQPYPLLLHDGWSINLQALERAITPQSRAIVVVHPANPTGHFTTAADREAIYNLAARYGLAVIADEVFLDYPVEGTHGSFLNQPAPALTFVLSGLSKVLALPQMKIGWTVVAGPADACREALHRLEFIADTFLSVAAPSANAVERWLPLAPAMQQQVQSRVKENLAALDQALAGAPALSRLPVQGGWSVILRSPANEPDEILAERLLRDHGVVTHPGSFYGLPTRGFLVLSLLVETERFRKGVQSVLSALHQ